MACLTNLPVSDRNVILGLVGSGYLQIALNKKLRTSLPQYTEFHQANEWNMRSWDIAVTGTQEMPVSAPENPRLKQTTKKERRRKNKPQHENIYGLPIT